MSKKQNRLKAKLSKDRDLSLLRFNHNAKKGQIHKYGSSKSSEEHLKHCDNSHYFKRNKGEWEQIFKGRKLAGKRKEFDKIKMLSLMKSMLNKGLPNDIYAKI